MARKFFSLAPLKLPSKAENERVKAALSAAEYSPPPFPQSVRNPPLSPKTEAELRRACAVIVRNFKPSDHHLYNDSKIWDKEQEWLERERERERERGERHHSFTRDKGRREREYKKPGERTRPETEDEREAKLIDQKRKARNEKEGTRLPRRHDSMPEVYRPTEAHDQALSAFAYKPQVPLKDLFSETDGTHPNNQANISRQRARDHSDRSKSSDKRSVSNPVKENPKLRKHSSYHQSHTNHSADTISSTPRTYTTSHPGGSSTALTSAALTPQHQQVSATKRLSKSISAAILDPLKAAQADAAASEWMRERQSRDTRPASPQRPPSRARSIASLRDSIRDEIREYIRPGSSNGRARLSRSASRESLRSVRSEQSKDGRDPDGSVPRWKSWSLVRKGSSGSLRSFRPGRQSMEEERGRSTEKAEINLNRELPPLPRLDQWEKHQEDKGVGHVVGLMKNIKARHQKKSSQDVTDRPQLAHNDSMEPTKRASPPAQSPGIVSTPPILRRRSSRHVPIVIPYQPAPAEPVIRHRPSMERKPSLIQVPSPELAKSRQASVDEGALAEVVAAQQKVQAEREREEREQQPVEERRLSHISLVQDEAAAMVSGSADQPAIATATTAAVAETAQPQPQSQDTAKSRVNPESGEKPLPQSPPKSARTTLEAPWFPEHPAVRGLGSPRSPKYGAEDFEFMGHPAVRLVDRKVGVERPEGQNEREKTLESERMREGAKTGDRREGQKQRVDESGKGGVRVSSGNVPMRSPGREGMKTGTGAGVGAGSSSEELGGSGTGIAQRRGLKKFLNVGGFKKKGVVA